jgi:hypothetical protein
MSRYRSVSHRGHTIKSIALEQEQKTQTEMKNNKKEKKASGNQLASRKLLSAA